MILNFLAVHPFSQNKQALISNTVNVPKLGTLIEEKNNIGPSYENFEDLNDENIHRNNLLYESEQSVDFEFLRDHNLKQFNISLK